MSLFPEHQIIKGHVTRYRFHNEDNSYSIATLKTEDERKITIVGYFPKVTSDLLYELEGNWIEHPTYGEQFEVLAFRRAKVASFQGLVSYLSSDYFPGIGPKTAEKIVNLLGDEAIEKIIDDKTVLKEIGLNPIRIERFYQQLLENQSLEGVTIDLFELDIKGATAMKLITTYGLKAATIAKTNPFRLIDEVSGIGFIRADEIREKVGIPEDDPKRIKAAILYSIREYGERNGDTYALEGQVFDYANQFLKIDIDYTPFIQELILERKLVLEEDRYYLAPAYYAELGLAKKILELNQTKRERVSEEKLNESINKIEQLIGITYTDIQKEAIKVSLNHEVTVITGGPGTGKTTIIDGLMQVYSDINHITASHMATHMKVMAPTGRAAKRMREILNFKATTIHKGLGMGYDGIFTFDENNLFPEKLIIIDEASMIDIFLANSLFKAINNDARVVIVGDVDQLPSVGPGLFLKDLIDSNVCAVVRLDEIHRQARGSNIVKIANKVNQQTLSYDDLVSESDTYIYKINRPELKRLILRLVEGALEQGYSLIEDIQILIPQYKGDFGIEMVNEMVQEMYIENKSIYVNHGDVKYYVGDKVIQLENDALKDVMNGDIGVVSGIVFDNKNKPTIYVNFDGRDLSYAKSDLDQLNLAYAISIHKSQGSEYPIVIIPIVKNYIHMLKKELLYTAITRAKAYLFIMGDVDLMIYASNRITSKRQSTLVNRLNDEINEENQPEVDDVNPYDFM
ncbi:MAG: ATP-dependent RecD-like DNA helicase [Acholeplasmataceae bacterium]|jgi:exodeoxyribonuclease V alpha subunit